MVRLRNLARRYCPRTYTAAIIAGCFLIFGIRWMLKEFTFTSVKYDNVDFVPPKIEFPDYKKFASMIQEAASDGNTVILAMVDTEYVNIAINFYSASIKKQGITNCVFLTVDKAVCKMMSNVYSELKQRCFLYDDGHIVNNTLYGSHHAPHFKDKRYLRRFLIVETLKLRHNVLVTDPDTIYFQNPLDDVKKACGKCDIAALWQDDVDAYDGGFVYARATERSIVFYENLASYELSHGSGQFALNAAMKDGKKKSTIKVEDLSSRKYKNGASFFEDNMCPGPKAAKGVLVVHNNYLRGSHNKVLRLRECKMWDWEGYDRYYRDPNRKYLSVETLGPRGYPEHQTLLNAFAIATTLKRTVILPRVECKKAKCNMLTRIYDEQHLHFVRHFDYATVNNYRESTFLENHRVPESTRSSVSPIFHIPFQVYNKTQLPKREDPSVNLVPKDIMKGPTIEEIREWLADRQEMVIRFETLTGWYRNFKYPDMISEELVKIIRQL